MTLDFISDDFLLESQAARKLYHGYAENQPIVDFHNHLDVKDILEDKKHADIGSFWVESDKYKHRAMRIAGFDERLISGDAPTREKFDAWCSLLPSLAGNPLFHWSSLEMKKIFGIEAMPCSENAEIIWNRCNELLQTPEFSTNSILRRLGVKRLTTSDDLLDDVSLHSKASKASGFDVTPSLRADSALNFDKPSFGPWFKKLSEGHKVKTLEDYLREIRKHIEKFQKNGCRLSDHALDDGFRFVNVSYETADGLFRRILNSQTLEQSEYTALKSFVLLCLGVEYAKRGWVMQLHIGAQRYTSSRLRAVAGPAGGFACPGNTVDMQSLCGFLDALDTQESLPKTILYTLNPSDNAALATLTGSYGLGNEQKLQFGPAWWYNDHKVGIEENLNALSSYSVLFKAVGMTTDSRNILSFSRHEYFRRVLCNYLGGMVTRGELPNDLEWLGSAVQNISYRNANKWIYNEQ